jgi:preprotein translocase subunit Sec61beta
MSFREERVSMPMGSAGIIGLSPDMKLSGIEFDAKNIIIATFIFTLVVKVAHALVKVV